MSIVIKNKKSDFFWFYFFLSILRIWFILLGSDEFKRICSPLWRSNVWTWNNNWWTFSAEITFWFCSKLRNRSWKKRKKTDRKFSSGFFFLTKGKFYTRKIKPNYISYDTKNWGSSDKNYNSSSTISGSNKESSDYSPTNSSTKSSSNLWKKSSSSAKASYSVEEFYYTFTNSSSK